MLVKINLLLDINFTDLLLDINFTDLTYMLSIFKLPHS